MAVNDPETQDYRATNEPARLWWVDATGHSPRRLGKAIADCGILLTIEPGETVRDPQGEKMRTAIAASLRRRDLHYQTWAPLAGAGEAEAGGFELGFVGDVVRHLPSCLISFGGSIERLAERIAATGGLVPVRLTIPRRTDPR